MTQYAKLHMLPNDPIYGLQDEFKKDTRPNKLNLSIGILVDQENRPYTFSCVKKAIKEVTTESSSFGYLPIDGFAPFTQSIETIVSKIVPTKFCINVIQTVGGTGALYVGLSLLHRAKISHIAIPNPSWPNHKQILDTMPFTVVEYPYKTHEGLSKTLDALKNLPENTSAIILHATCHNPTGIDLEIEEVQSLIDIAKKKNAYIFFDAAYLGLSKGFETDFRAMELCLKQHDKVLIALSFAKNCGLYNERPGALVTITQSAERELVIRNVKNIIRTTYSSPSAFGAKVVAKVLSQIDLKNEWDIELGHVRDSLRIKKMTLFQELQKNGLEKLCPHIESTSGLFCLLDLMPDEIENIKQQSGVYLSLDGRVNIAGLKEEVIPHFVNALSKCLNSNH